MEFLLFICLPALLFTIIWNYLVAWLTSTDETFITDIQGPQND